MRLKFSRLLRTPHKLPDPDFNTGQKAKNPHPGYYEAKILTDDKNPISGKMKNTKAGNGRTG